MQEPNPFSKFNEADKTFSVGPNDQFWQKACIEKFDWVNRTLSNGPKALTAAELALVSDENRTNKHQRVDILTEMLTHAQQPGNVLEQIQKSTVYEDYPATFSWM